MGSFLIGLKSSVFALIDQSTLDECFFFCLQDVTDFEWEFWLSAIKSLMPAMLLHTIGGIIFSRFLSQVRNLFFSLLENL